MIFNLYNKLKYLSNSSLEILSYLKLQKFNINNQTKLNFLNQIEIKNGLETFGLGTGAAVADIDGDGILELLISHGESGAQPLSLFKANVLNTNYLRIKPLNTFGAPARGATVTLNKIGRAHV